MVDAESRYSVGVADKLEIVIRTLEVEADMDEAQAKRFSEEASSLSSESEQKVKLQALAEEATQRAGLIRHQVRLLRDHQYQARQSRRP